MTRSTKFREEAKWDERGTLWNTKVGHKGGTVEWDRSETLERPQIRKKINMFRKEKTCKVEQGGGRYSIAEGLKIRPNVRTTDYGPTGGRTFVPVSK